MLPIQFLSIYHPKNLPKLISLNLSNTASPIILNPKQLILLPSVYHITNTHKQQCQFRQILAQYHLHTHIADIVLICVKGFWYPSRGSGVRGVVGLGGLWFRLLLGCCCLGCLDGYGFGVSGGLAMPCYRLVWHQNHQHHNLKISKTSPNMQNPNHTPISIFKNSSPILPI